MPTNQNNDMMVYCSFCGKSQDEVQKIIAGTTPLSVMNVSSQHKKLSREELAEEVLADLSEVPKPIDCSIS